jgi:hypothetical protein
MWRTVIKKLHLADLVPFYVKIKAVTLAQLHSTWSIKMTSSKTITAYKENAFREMIGIGSDKDIIINS